MERRGCQSGEIRCLGLPHRGCHLQGDEPEGGVQPADEQDARIVAKASQSVANAFRWMGLTVWVLKCSGSGWRGGGSEGRKSPQEIAAFGDGFSGKNWRKSSDAFLVIPDYLPTTAVF